MASLDINDVYIENGITSFKLGSGQNADIDWVYEYDDMGADPEQVDATPLTSKVAKKKDGVIDLDNWTFRYYKNASDYDKIQALKTAGESIAISITFEDGDIVSNTGKIVSHYKLGGSNNSMQSMQVSIALNSEWTLTHA